MDAKKSFVPNPRRLLSVNGFVLLPWLLAFSSFAASVRADEGAYQKTGQGICVKVGQAEVELAAATTTAFRLSVSYDGKPTPIATCFLSASAGAVKPAWEVAKAENSIGVKTAAGELRIDPASGKWTLLDAKGATLIPPSCLGALNATASPKETLDLPISTGTNSPFQFYGCGNGLPASLQQTTIQSRVGNGLAVIPHYWSNSGYSILAVGGDDNKPATAALSADKSSLVWHFIGKRADLYLMPAATLTAAARAYGQLSGTPPVPPRWAFGYLQSLWGWRDRAHVEDTLQKFWDRHIPVDAFIYDFEWYKPPQQRDYDLPPEGDANFPDFRWNPKVFPDPTKQIDAYHAKGLHFIGIRKPRIGDSNSLKLMREKGWILREITADANRDKYHTRDVDFKNPDLRAWYGDQLKPILQNDIYGWWNDEGEGSFTTYYYWNLAEIDVFARTKPGRRLWMLDRAFSPGVQRQGAACWTGDIQANWRIFSETPTTLLNWSLAGMTYCGCDIGGYSPETAPDLLARWMEAGVFFPVFRAHSECARTPHFPWLFGPDAESAIHKAIDLRYRLIPYYYSLAYEAHATGVPLMRPLMMEFPDDPQVANLSSQWLMGRGLMAAPILQADGKRTVYLPQDDWFQFDTATKLPGGQTLDVTAKLDEIPIYVRAGTLLPLGPVVQNTDQLPGGPLEVQIYPGKDATFTLVEDDGETTSYLQGAFRRTTFTWDDAARRLSWKKKGSYAGNYTFLDMKISLFDPGAKTAPTPVTASLNADGSVVIPH